MIPAVVCLGLFLAAPATSRAGDARVRVVEVGPLALRYEQLVERYREGERAEAVTGLEGWRPGDLEAQAGRLRGDPALRDRLLLPAVMLHLDRALQDGRRSDEGGERTNLDVALGLLKGAPMGERTRDFRRRFHLAAALAWQGAQDWQVTRELLTRGLDLFPEDAEMLLALGSVEETTATIGRSTAVAHRPLERGAIRRRQVSAEADHRARLQAAERLFTKALGSDPALAEAALRRGRVRFLLGQAEAARPDLELTAEGAPDTALRYLAHLTLGQMEGEAGSWEEAEAAFARASSLFAEAPAALVALSHAQLRQGHRSDARQSLLRALGTARRGDDGRDPWWSYPWGQRERAEALLQELREEASR